MPTFCRHNRFIERCPICSADLARAGSGDSPARAAAGGRDAAKARSGGRPRPAAATTTRRGRTGHGSAQSLRVYRDGAIRAVEDGYRCELVPGLRASAEAERLAAEIGFSSGRMKALREAPAGLYASARELGDLEQATWTCVMIAYLSPVDQPDPFVGIRAALDQASWDSGGAPDLEGAPLGPRTSHQADRGGSTLDAYRQWAARMGGQEAGLEGDPDWTPQRRFERAFERLRLPGLSRAGRYELLLALGALGLYELSAPSLELGAAGATGAGPNGSGTDLTLAGAKRVFGIGDPVNLERRSRTLAEAAEVPVGALDLALDNWERGRRATVGFPADVEDPQATASVRDALGL